MKNIPIAIAFVASIGCTYILLTGTKEDDIKNYQSNAIGIEIGVFKKKDNALDMQKKLGGCVIEDNDVYRIYYGILQNSDNIHFITNYLQNAGISYYIKDMLLADDVIAVLREYEKDIYKQKKDDMKIKTMFKFLEKYEEVI